MVDTYRKQSILPVFDTIIHCRNLYSLPCTRSISKQNIYTMPDLYIPPKEISFRLKNKSTNKVLFSRKQSPTFGQFDGETFADQYWQLVPGTGEWKGQYLVKSMVTGKILFSRTQRSPPVDHIDSDGRWADQWFKPVCSGANLIGRHLK